jgi:outer membrane protein
MRRRGMHLCSRIIKNRWLWGFTFIGGVILASWSSPVAVEVESEVGGGKGDPATTRQAENVKRLNLQECLDLALQNSRLRPASRFAIEAAEAQHQQALSAYWAQLAVKSAYTTMDEDPNFIFPSFRGELPASELQITTPLGQLPVSIPATPYQVPEQDIKLMDRENFVSSLTLNYPLYTGGLRGALAKQAASGLEAAKEEARRTDLQIVYDVRRMYYGAVLARNLGRIAGDTLARMEMTLALTESLYTQGSGRVKKTDYLRNKTVVEGLRAVCAFLSGTEKTACAALTNTMGLEWSKEIAVAEETIPFIPYAADLKEVVINAYEFNPDWAKLAAGLAAAEAKVDEAESGHFPKFALVGNLNHVENSYDKGLATPENRNSWCVGVAMELPVFTGFRTKHEVREALARLGKLKEERVLLREGIALQAKHLFIQMMSAQEQKKASEEAMKAAEENRDLNERAYQAELVETKDVIEAQLMESFMQGQYQKALFDHMESQVHLEYVVGKEVDKLLGRGMR